MDPINKLDNLYTALRNNDHVGASLLISDSEVIEEIKRLHSNFLMCVGEGDINKVKLLISDPCINSHTIDDGIVIAAHKGHMQIIRILLSEKDIKIYDEYNYHKNKLIQSVINSNIVLPKI
jgi:hypothetical protein